MAGTVLIFWNGMSFEKLELDAGQFVIFNRGFIHCGGTYANENRRVHTYLLMRGETADGALTTKVDNDLVVLKHPRKTCVTPPPKDPSKTELGRCDEQKVIGYK